MKARFLALAALVLGLASCQQEFNDVAQLGGEVDYQLKVDAAELATRAGVDGSNDLNNAYDSAFGAIDYLQACNDVDDYRVDWKEVDLRYSLEVYDWNEEGNYTDAVPVKDRMVKIVDKYESVVFDLRLVPGRNYHFVVFADFVPNGADANPAIDIQRDLGKRHTIGYNLGDIRIKENEDAINDEIGDAYFATKKVEVKHQALNVDGIVLQRPYGKLRVIATDLAELNLNVEPKSVFVKYTANRPVHFNAVTGAVETDATVKEYTSAYNDGVCKLIANNTIGLANHFYNAGYDSGSDDYSTVNADGVKRHTHMTLFTDYILAIDDQTTVQFEMTVSDANKEIKKTVFNTEIPVQRNHLTTIVGNVLTSATEITVTINDNFANNPTDAPYYQVAVENGFEFVNAYYSGLKMFALNDITVRAKDVADYMATRSGDVINPSIDLNGHTLTFVNNTDDPLLEVRAGSSFTITDSKGEGEVKVDGTGTGAAIENNGTLNIEGVELESKTEGSVIDNNGEANIVDSTLNNGALTNDGEANIAGGTLNAGSVENNGQADFTDSTLNTGSVENNGQADFTNSTLNEGSVENNGQANVNGGDVNNNAVVNGEGAVVGSQSAEDLQRAINNAKRGTANKFTLNSDIVGDVTINQKEGVNITIDGNGHKFDGTIFVDGKNRHDGEETLVIKNIKFETSTTAAETKYFIKGLTEGNSYPHNITITDCSFESTVVNNYNVAGIWFQQFYKLDVINCSAKYIHSLLQAQSCDNYVNVEKARIQACKNGISFGNTANATLKGSTINAVEYGVRGDGNASRGNLVIENSKIEAATPVIIRKMTKDGYKVSMNGTKTLNKKSGFYHVVFTNGNDDEAYAVPTGKFEYTGFDADWVVFPYTWEVKSKTEFDQALASPATSKITFGSDITGNLTIEQKPDVELTIDGANKNLKGCITVDGKSATYTTAALTIMNLNFNAETINADACINLGVSGNNNTRYTCNVTAKKCTFDVADAVGVKSYTGGDKNLTINECTATAKAHSLVQAAGIDTINVVGCKVESKNGMNFNQSDNVAINGCKVDVKGYAVRFGASSGTSNTAETYSITGSSLKSACEEEGDAVIVLRATADNATLTIENTTIEGTPKFINSAANANVYVDGALMVSNVEGLKAALKDANVSSILLGSNITVTEDWDCRYTGAKMDRAITIDGDGNTLKFTGKVDDKNYMTAFRFEADATIKNLTFDMSEVAGTGGQLRAISSKEGKLIVDNCTFVGSSNYTKTRGIIFGEGVQAATNNTIASVTNSTFTNWKRGLTDNENAKDAKDVTVTGNTFNNAHCYVSAHDSIVLTGNTMNNSCVNIKTYTMATDATVVATGNNLDATLADYNNISGFAAANVTCQEGFNVY